MRKRIRVRKSQPMILDFQTTVTKRKMIGEMNVPVSWITERVRRKAEPLPF